jgi:low affinity Fe/Cu permease
MPTGSQHDAYQQIRSIIQATKTQIFIVDNYVDESTWQLLTNVSATVAIRILTTKMQNDFALEGKHFKAQHGNTVEVRKTGKVHDRFIVIDRARGWHLGPSIKDAGSKAALISEIHSPSVIAAATQEIENLWNTSTVVTI